MRAPRTGRWGPEPIRGRGQELGGGLGRRAEEERREAGLCRPPVPFPILSLIPTSTPLGICTCKEEQVPSLTLAPGCKGSVLRHPKVTDRLPPSHLTQVPLPSSPCTLWPALLGWCPPRAGELLHCVLEKMLGKGRGADSPLVPALSLLSLLSPHGSFSPNVLQRGRSLKASLQPSQPKSSASTPHLGGVARTESVSECRVCVQGHVVRARAFCPHAYGRRNSPEAENPFPSLFLAFP